MLEPTNNATSIIKLPEATKFITWNCGKSRTEKNDREISTKAYINIYHRLFKRREFEVWFIHIRRTQIRLFCHNVVDATYLKETSSTITNKKRNTKHTMNLFHFCCLQNNVKSREQPSKPFHSRLTLLCRTFFFIFWNSRKEPTQICGRIPKLLQKAYIYRLIDCNQEIFFLLSWFRYEIFAVFDIAATTA